MMECSLWHMRVFGFELSMSYLLMYGAGGTACVWMCWWNVFAISVLNLMRLNIFFKVWHILYNWWCDFLHSLHILLVPPIVLCNYRFNVQLYISLIVVCGSSSCVCAHTFDSDGIGEGQAFSLCIWILQLSLICWWFWIFHDYWCSELGWC